MSRVATVRHGDPAQSDTVMGPVIDLAAAEQVMERVAASVTMGARVLAGGTCDGTLVAPTVLDRVVLDAPVIATETFGPVLAIRGFHDIDAAVDEVNTSAYGLQAGIFTNDHAMIRRVGRRLQVGGLMVNEGPDFRAEHVPFGGIKTSGLGREGVRITMREMSETHVIID